MTDRGKLICCACDELATWIDEPSSKNASSCDFWCDNHLMPPKEDCIRFNIMQELITLPDQSKIWYPYWKKPDGSLKGWPFVGADIMLWGFMGPWSINKKQNYKTKKWWQFWK